MSDKCIPFSNGSQSYDWDERNCWRCDKYNSNPDDAAADCDLYDLLSKGLIMGEVTEECGERMGYYAAHKDFHADPKNNPPPYTWDCPERVDAGTGL